MCTGEDYCESKENILKWLSGNKYVMLVYNTVIFDSEATHEESKIEEAHMSYIPINSQMRDIVPHRLETTYLELHDNLVIDLDSASWGLHKDLFKIKEMPRLPQEKDENVQILITIEREFDVQSIERMAYTTFDMLSDVGGLLGIMVIISRGAIAIWNFNSFDNFLVSRLFKIKLPKEDV